MVAIVIVEDRRPKTAYAMWPPSSCPRGNRLSDVANNPNQAAISKIARQVMTRLHIQVNQTIQFYRNQQGGSAPQRLFLAGGASLMPYTAEFFSEKLALPAEAVEYFNPFPHWPEAIVYHTSDALDRMLGRKA